MKKIYLIIALLCVSFTCIISCKEENVEIPNLNVLIDKTEYVVGEYAKFQLSGNSDFISFYPGETGKRYEFVNRTTENGTPILSFKSALANGSQEESIKLLISSDFLGTGERDSATFVQNIANATWSDITDRATWATSSSNTGSGDIDLSDFTDKPVYIAFKYKGYAGSKQNKWTISSLVLKNNLDDGTSYTIANHSNSAINNYGVSTTVSPGWVSQNTMNRYNWVVSSSNFVISGSTDDITSSDAESWCVSGPIDLTHVTPDVGILIQNMSGTTLNYEYQFKTAGEYKITFVGKNSSIYGMSGDITKEFNVVIQSAN